MSGIKRVSAIYWLLSVAPLLVSLYLPSLRVFGSSIYLGTLYLFFALCVLVAVGGIGISKRMLLLVLAFNVVNFVSFLVSGFYLDDFLIATLQYNFFFFFVLIFYSARIDVDVRLYWVACFFPVIYGLVLFFIDPASVVAFGRFSSIFDNPNSAGLYFLSVTGICLAYSFKLPFGWFVRFALLAILFVAIILTGSFGALFGFVTLVLLNHLWANWALGSRHLFASAMKFLAVSLLFYFSYLVFVRIGGAWSFDFDFRSISRIGDVLIDGHGRVGSFDERNQLSEAAFERVLASKDFGLFGFGLGQGRYSFSLVDGDFTPVHNVFLSLVLDVGFVGLALYGCVFRLLCKKFCVSRADWIVFIAFFMGFALTPSVYLPFFWVPTFFYFAAKNKNDKNRVCDYRVGPRRGGDYVVQAVGADRSPPIRARGNFAFGRRA